MSEGGNRSIGALWVKQGPRGKFLAGKVVIDGIEHGIVVFKNDRKQSDKAPDYSILPGRDRSEQRREEPPPPDDFV